MNIKAVEFARDWPGVRQHAERCVLLMLAAIADEAGHSQRHGAEIARLCQMGKRTSDGATKTLERAGAIARTKIGQQPSRLTVLYPEQAADQKAAELRAAEAARRAAEQAEEDRRKAEREEAERRAAEQAEANRRKAEREEAERRAAERAELERQQAAYRAQQAEEEKRQADIKAQTDEIHAMMPADESKGWPALPWRWLKIAQQVGSVRGWERVRQIRALPADEQQAKIDWYERDDARIRRMRARRIERDAGQ